MDQLINISILSETEKYNFLDKVKPNLIFNRLDLFYKTDKFKMLEVVYAEKRYYIEFYNDNGFCHIGLYMSEIPQEVFDKVIQYLNKHYKNIFLYDFPYSFVKHKNCEIKWNNNVIELPKTYESYIGLFSSKHRYNIRSQRKKLEENFNCKFEYYTKEMIDEDFKKQYWQLKSRTCKDVIECVLDIVNEAYVIKIDDIMVAAALFSVCDDKNVYCSTIAYDREFYKYSLGLMILYYSIEQFINRKFEKLYMGNGNGYKDDIHAKKIEVYQSDRVLDLSFCQKLFLFKKYKYLDFEYTLVMFLGLKFQFKKKLKSKYQ